MKEKLKNFRWGYVILFAILTAIGILSFIFREMLVYIVLAVGIIITLFGIGYGIYTLASKNRGPRFAFGIVITVCAIVSGVLTIIFCKNGIEVLTSILGLFFIIDGSFKLQTTAMSKRYKSAIWWILLIPAVLTIIGGFLTVKYAPTGSEENLAWISILLGITSIIDGISNLLSAFFTERNDKAEVKELLDGSAAPSENGAEGDSPKEEKAADEGKPQADTPADAPVTDEPTDKPEADAPKEEPKADTPADDTEGEKPTATDNGDTDEFKITIPIITE